MKSRIGVKSLKCDFWIDQFQGRPSPKNTLIFASPNRRRFASRSICLPKVFELAMLLSTVRTSRLGRQSAFAARPFTSGSEPTVVGVSTVAGGLADATDSA